MKPLTHITFWRRMTPPWMAFIHSYMHRWERLDERNDPNIDIVYIHRLQLRAGSKLKTTNRVKSVAGHLFILKSVRGTRCWISQDAKTKCTLHDQTAAQLRQRQSLGNMELSCIFTSNIKDRSFSSQFRRSHRDIWAKTHNTSGGNESPFDDIQFLVCAHFSKAALSKTKGAPYLPWKC